MLAILLTHYLGFAAEMNATLSHRGRGQVTKGSTLYFGKSSRRSSVKFYAKGEEFQKALSCSFLTASCAC